jgi:hypothetical protein
MAGITRTTRRGGMLRQVYHTLRTVSGRIRHPRQR